MREMTSMKGVLLKNKKHNIKVSNIRKVQYKMALELSARATF